MYCPTCSLLQSVPEITVSDLINVVDRIYFFEKCGICDFVHTDCILSLHKRNIMTWMGMCVTPGYFILAVYVCI